MQWSNEIFWTLFSDNTINSYLSLVLNCNRISLPPSIFIFNANFTQYFASINNETNFTLEFLNQNGIGGSCFSQCDTFYFPVHVSGDFEHWILIRLERKTKIITQFDSLNGDFYANIEANFRKFLKAKIPGDQFKASEYSFNVGFSARQSDSSSCGIYCILNLLTEINLLTFQIESTPSFIKMIKTIMIHEFLSFVNDEDCFILDILGSTGSQWFKPRHVS